MKIFYSILFSIYFLAGPQLLSINQESLPSDFSNPRKTMKFFLKSMTIYKNGDPKGLLLATKTLNLNEIDPITHNTVGKQAAIDLINTIDRIAYIKINTIPIRPKKDLWIFSQKNISLENSNKIIQAQIAIGKTNHNKWLFTPQTIKTIHHYERYIRHKSVISKVKKLNTWKIRFRRKLPPWIFSRFFIFTNIQWIGLFLLIFLAFIVQNIIRFYINKALDHLFNIGKFTLSAELRRKFTSPLFPLCFSSLLVLGLPFLELNPPVLSWFFRIGKILFTIGMIMTLYELINIVSLYLLKKSSLKKNTFNNILIPFIQKIAKTIVIGLGLIIIGESLTFNMKGLLAGLGIIGLGISLAAKDTLSNFFGSLTILIDRPFKIGDWVVIDNDVEGTIEDVGLRSCRIRTFYNSLISLPNGKLTNAIIDNYGKRSYRRLSTTLSIEYSTPLEKVELFCEEIRNIVKNHPQTRKDYFHVYLSKLGESSLDIMLYIFFQTKDWSQELQQRHNLYLQILAKAENMDIRFAYPTQTLKVIPPDKTNYSSEEECGKPKR